MKVSKAAAGTCGHINPGFAIANKILEENKNSEVIFIGTNRGLEKDLVPRAGYKLKTIDSYGISRSLSLSNIKKLVKTIHSIKEAKNILKEFKPDLVIGTGGYICISVCLAAKKLKVPYIIHESNVLPGVATKLLSKNAEKILVGFKEAKDKLPKAKKIVVTGTPTKVEKLELSNKEIEDKKKELGFDINVPLILVFGGSQGAKSINTSMLEIIKKKYNKNYQIMWAAGPEQYKIFKEKLKEDNLDIENLEKAKIVPYIYDMGNVMNIADLIVCRSGPVTVTEIQKVGKASIFIPFPYATENHQEYNARALEKKKAAKVILDKDLTEDILNDNINNLIKDKQELENMGKRANEMSIQNVEDKIYREIERK